MTTPFSDTETPSAPTPSAWALAQSLAKRLGLPPATHPGHWGALKFHALHTLLDRMEKLENSGGPQV